jgi:putative membrane protein
MCDSKKASHPGPVPGFFLPLIACSSFCLRNASAQCRTTLAFMLWVKAFHIVFIASWFAGLFYLPRIFVNLAQVPADVPSESHRERERLLLMASKLLRFTTLLAVPALALGAWLWLGYGIGRGPGNGWLHAKLAVVVLAVGYHHVCARLLRKFSENRNTHSHVWFRWFNEVPVFLLTAAVILVVVKPF